jgi:hypothetical protein
MFLINSVLPLVENCRKKIQIPLWRWEMFRAGYNEIIGDLLRFDSTTKMAGRDVVSYTSSI